MDANIANPTTFYDTRGRQKTYIESAMQRKERIEFLKQREWIRRVAEWVKETNAQNYSVRLFARLSVLVFTRSPAKLRSLQQNMLPGWSAICHSLSLRRGRRGAVHHLQRIPELFPFLPFRRNHPRSAPQQWPLSLAQPCSRRRATTRPETIIWTSPKM